MLVILRVVSFLLLGGHNAICYMTMECCYEASLAEVSRSIHYLSVPVAMLYVMTSTRRFVDTFLTLWDERTDT